MGDVATPLVETLRIAVPMWQHDVAAMDAVARAARGVELSQIVAEAGDQLLFKGPRTREVFNALAEGIAIASYAPGGITFHGVHWEMAHG